MAIIMSKGGFSFSDLQNKVIEEDTNILKKVEKLHKRITTLVSIAKKSEGALREQYMAEISGLYTLMDEEVCSTSKKIQSGEIAISKEDYVKIKKLYEEVLHGVHILENPENDNSIDISAMDAAKRAYNEITDLLGKFDQGGHISDVNMKILNDKLKILGAIIVKTKAKRAKRELLMSDEDFNSMVELYQFANSKMQEIEIKFMLESDSNTEKEQRKAMTNSSHDEAQKNGTQTMDYIDFQIEPIII